MKNKYLLVILIASVFAMASNSMRTVDLTVINKSEVDIGLMLSSMTDDDRWYYFTIPNGYPDAPQGSEDNYTERHYEIVWDVYTSVAYFMEPYDPVYGYPNCGNKAVGSRLIATHSVKLVYKPCKQGRYHPHRYRRIPIHRESKVLAR
jgi:hypothetical protein